MRKKTPITILLFIIMGISACLYLYKGHRDIGSETADYVLTVNELEREFTSNDSLAYIKYQDKTIELSARVTSIDKAGNGIVMGEKVFVTFKNRLPQNIISGKSLKIKGRFLGYDELLQEFKIDQSSVVR